MDRSFFSRERLAAFLGIAALALCLAWLPSGTNGVFASPDETGVAAVTAEIARTGRARISETLAPAIPWLHPRSFVSQGEYLVPIGFLGWPTLLSPFVRLFGQGILPWVGALVVLSAVYPVFWLFRRRFGEVEALWGTVLLFSFPTVLLYGNRGLFANLPQLALFAWWFLLALTIRDRGQMASIRRCVLLGVLGVLLLAFRPFEALWLLPWMIWLARPRAWSLSQRVAVGAGSLLILLVLAIVTLRTYGSVFAIGYLLRDNVLPPNPSSLLPPQQSLQYAFSGSTSLWERLKGFANALPPYGFHPRTIWWNLRSFTGVFLWPWFLALAMVWAPMLLKIKRTTLAQISTTTKWVWALSIWTILVLLAVYGSGFYTDHIQVGAVTIGSSFLRYLLPLVPLWVYAFLGGAHHFSGTVKARFVLSIVTFVLMLVGLFSAFAKDDEGLLATRRELQRYTQIRSEAVRLFPPESVIFSDRSDKIFFPVLRAVTPVPALWERARLSYETRIPAVGLFSRPLSQADRDGWRQAGFEVQELTSFGREQLYRLVPLRR